MEYTSSIDFASFTPPPFPLPPACTWAFITKKSEPVSSFSLFANATAFSGVEATYPL